MRMSVLIWNNAGHYNNLDQTNTLFLCEKRNQVMLVLFRTLVAYVLHMDALESIYCRYYSERFIANVTPCFLRGFAISRPSAQRPAAHDPWRPSPDFCTVFFCPAVNPRGCTDLHRIWTDKIDDGEFELPFNYLNPCFCLLLVVQIKKRFILCSVVSLQKPIAQ